MKDRLEVLLYAETLQETLSPNANPRQGPVGGYQNWMPKAAARIQRAAQTLLHLSSTRFVIPKRTGLRKGGTKKVTGGGCAAGGWATLTSIKTIGGAPLLAFEKWAAQPSIPKAFHAAGHRIFIFSTSHSLTFTTPASPRSRRGNCSKARVPVIRPIRMVGIGSQSPRPVAKGATRAGHPRSRDER